MLTKLEMEKMWQTGPINVLRDFSKKSRGKKSYNILITPYKTAYKTTDIQEHAKTYTVWSKKQDDAVCEAKAKWYHEHYDVNQTGIKVSIVA